MKAGPRFGRFFREQPKGSPQQQPYPRQRRLAPQTDAVLVPGKAQEGVDILHPGQAQQAAGDAAPPATADAPCAAW